MTEFNELDLAKDVSEMDGDEAKETLAEFMDAHEQNQEAYDTLKAEKRKEAEEYSEQIDELEERVSQFKQERAEEASQYANMPADLLAERFSFSELDQIIEEGEEATDEEDTEFSEDEDAEDERLTTFSERPPKGKQESSGGSSYNRDRAKEKIFSHW
jgi:murein DD-endopeptidase MepM/ murein hydrolase activator NlpD